MAEDPKTDEKAEKIPITGGAKAKPHPSYVSILFSQEIYQFYAHI